MFAPTVQLAVVLLLAAAIGPARASMVSKMKEGKLDFCGKQACFAPNRCLPFLGVTVCVRPVTPKCGKCPTNTECALLQDVCQSLPCHPKAYCVKHNPCGICQPPDHFCDLLPTPRCRHVVEPTCQNKICGFGETCKREPLQCSYPPCRVKFSCVPAWPYNILEHHVDAAVAKKSAVAALGGDLGGVFNVFNGFTPKVEKAFIAGRTASVGGAGRVDSGGSGGEGGDGDTSSAGGDGGAGGAGDAGSSGHAGSGGAWPPYNPYGHQETVSSFNGFNGFNGNNGINDFGGGQAGAGGAGGDGGSSGHSYGSYDYSSDSGFGYNRPISHAAGAFSTLPSVGGGSPAGGKAEVEPKKAGPKTKEEASAAEENGSESDTDDEE